MVLLLLIACAGRPPAEPDPAPVRPAATIVASEGLEADLARAQAFHAARPPYEQPWDAGQQAPEGVGSLSANACGACHQEIAAEWAESTHALAWRDRQFQAEIGKSDNRWLCLNCHTPLLSQHDRWPVGLTGGDVEAPELVPNASFDASLREEGITCAACHVREGVIHGPGLEGSTAPHPVAPDESFRSDSALCLRCHQAVAEYPGKTFTCTFRTGEEWVAGPYDDEGTGCVDCHMPSVERPAAEGGPVRTVRRHSWRGAGIPKEPGVQPPVSANPPGLGLEARWEEGALALTMTNANAGHRLPSGDPERWVQVDVRFEDAAGAAIGEPWAARFGQRWEWYPAPKQLSDDRLAPREARTERIPAPPGAARAVVEASSHRMTPEAAGYHALDGYPLSIATHRLVVTPAGSTGGVIAE